MKLVNKQVIKCLFIVRETLGFVFVFLLIGGKNRALQLMNLLYQRFEVTFDIWVPRSSVKLLLEFSELVLDFVVANQ